MWIQTPRKVQLCKMRKVQIKKRLSDNGDELRGELSETPDQGCNKKSTEDLQNLQLVELWMFHTKWKGKKLTVKDVLIMFEGYLKFELYLKGVWIMIYKRYRYLKDNEKWWGWNESLVAAWWPFICTERGRCLCTKWWWNTKMQKYKKT